MEPHCRQTARQICQVICNCWLRLARWSCRYHSTRPEKYPFGHKKFTLGVSGRGALQRSDYGMDYGVANALVGDTVELIIEIEANQEK